MNIGKKVCEVTATPEREKGNGIPACQWQTGMLPLIGALFAPSHVPGP
jgi:hypothetical protein